MKQSTGISASIAAIASSLSTLLCCLPVAFAGAIGAVGAGAFFLRFRYWFLGLSVALLGLGFWQQRRATQCAVRARRLSQALLWTAVALVAAMIFFPQQIAGFIADRFASP